MYLLSTKWQKSGILVTQHKCILNNVNQNRIYIRAVEWLIVLNGVNHVTNYFNRTLIVVLMHVYYRFRGVQVLKSNEWPEMCRLCMHLPLRLDASASFLYFARLRMDVAAILRVTADGPTMTRPSKAAFSLQPYRAYYGHNVRVCKARVTTVDCNQTCAKARDGLKNLACARCRQP